jgi:hypothetical protein
MASLGGFDQRDNFISIHSVRLKPFQTPLLIYHSGSSDQCSDFYIQQVGAGERLLLINISGVFSRKSSFKDI